ncbi:Ornithine decarboxylase [Trichoplax sp. H2]|nr:Ornithine decarboxylase [Trichoplax sp. H2]|eukprot:RDD38517.1 Ornithine decarboxylase [Trichoplax sp. H2]
MMNEDSALNILPEFSLRQLIQKIATNRIDDDDRSFYIANIGDVIYKVQRWMSLLPRVQPFYAVKCNNDINLLATLNALGVGFDAASKNEMEAIVKICAHSSKVIYANPCKQISHLKFAERHGIALMTFDNVSELHKIKRCYPEAKLLLRIKIDDFGTLYHLSEKYGVDIEDCPNQLQVARDLQLNVVGISFHIGGGRYDGEIFASAIQLARKAFHYGICAKIRQALDEYFPIEDQVKIMSEPGRYFAESAFHLVMDVIGKREINTKELTAQGEQKKYAYYVNESLHGSFGNVLHDFDNQRFLPVSKSLEGLFSSTVWGYSCSGLDYLLKECQLLELDIGDLLYAEGFGAYSSVFHSPFNGFSKSSTYYFIELSIWETVKEKLSKCLKYQYVTEKGI